MYGLDTELKQTRFYQEIALEERHIGRQEGGGVRVGEKEGKKADKKNVLFC